MRLCPHSVGSSGELCVSGSMPVCVLLWVCTWGVCARMNVCTRDVRVSVLEDLAKLVCIRACVSTSVHASAGMESGVRSSPDTQGVYVGPGGASSCACI